jgi:hypothetical protein
MRCVTAAIIIAVGIVTAGTAAAQDRDPQWNRCVLYDEHGKLRAGASPDLAIGACTAIIQSSQETANGLAAAFLNRGRGYAGKRDYDRAIQDYDQAIRLDPNNAAAFSSRGNAYNHKHEYDRAIQDPPRAGCDPEALGELLRLGPERLVYVSCEPSTHARDLIGLVRGGYRIRRAAIVDMFPQTYHIETVALLERGSG